MVRPKGLKEGVHFCQFRFAQDVCLSTITVGGRGGGVAISVVKEFELSTLKRASLVKRPYVQSPCVESELRIVQTRGFMNSHV